MGYQLHKVCRAKAAKYKIIKQKAPSDSNHDSLCSWQREPWKLIKLVNLASISQKHRTFEKKKIADIA